MDMEKLVALCRRRGFIFQSSEIYGGINGFWDYGPLGAELKKNIKDAWWHDMVRNPPPGPDGQEINMVGVDCAIIMNPKVWEASGHVGGFADAMIECKKCRKRFRADKVFFALIPQGLGAIVLTCEADSDKEARATLAAIYEKEGKKNKYYLEWAAKISSGEAGIRSALEVADFQRRCPVLSCGGELLPEARKFNLMFKTFVGAVEDPSAVAWLRPETAQGIFVNYKNVLDSTRLKLPFGIAQIGKAFRNEINPRNYTFRSREFEQMEIEFFCHPAESMKWYQYWRDVRIRWYSELGIKSDKLKPREQGKEELAHYSCGTTDIEYYFPFAEEPQELEGVAHRGSFDLDAHAQHSGKDLRYFDEDGWNQWLQANKASLGGDKKKEQEAKQPFLFTPHVIEPSAGADRFALAVLCEAYDEDEVGGEARTVMRFHPRLAPIKAAILPLVNKEGMPQRAQALYRELKQEFNVFYDDGGAVGRRYRRQDEAGTPYCITIDGQTLQDDTVTIRDRDTIQQRRISMKEVAAELRRALRPGR